MATREGIIEEAVQGKPGILILYLCRPGCTSDGIALTRRLRQDERTTELPIILLTESADAEDEERSERAGADRALPKSWPAAVLACEVRRVIAARRRRSFHRASRSDDA